MRPDSDGWFNAIELADHIGFASEKVGAGKICNAIQTTGSRNASKNRFSNCAAEASSASGPLAAIAAITAATSASTCCAKEPFAIAKIGVAASNAMRR
ncbi:hypothetical protein MTR72_18935 [Bradyrhizobium sp. ISRA442]|uniref:hypothetical protein n=1 Tax=Bradyrhizobium sp. ISRA442 TaxID=2866197 RepID=UPI00311AD3E9